MAMNRKLPPSTIEADCDAVIGIFALDDYAPRDAANSAAVLSAQREAMEQARQNEVRIINMLAAARDATQATEWALHNTVLGAKTEVLAQYGVNSDAVASVGLKKKSDRKRPSRKAKTQTL